MVSSMKNTSERANRPISAGSSGMPLRKASVMVKRALPEIGSKPMVASSSPNNKPMKPFRKEPLLSTPTRLKPRTASEKYSGGPKIMAILTIETAVKIRKIVPVSAPKPEPRIDNVRALAASPFRRIG